MPVMNKPELHQLIVAALEQDLAIAQRAAQTAYETATHEENIAENKYDTLGLEASYLATGQARRMAEIAHALKRLRELPVLNHQPVRGIQPGDYIELETPEGQTRALFLGPDAAGLVVTAQGRAVTVITPHAPLGRALVGKQAGEDISVAVAGKAQDYYIALVC
jgi:transcription elongation GreA/GreB family factor